MPGHPDFQAYAQWQSANMLPAGSTNIAPGSIDTGIVPLTSWSGLSVRVEPASSYGTVTVQWYEDSAGTLQTGQDSWHVGSSTGLYVFVPAEAPFVKVTITNSGAVGMTGVPVVRGIAWNGARIYYPIAGQYLSKTGIAVPASQSVTYTLPFIRNGLAWLDFHPADATGKLQVILQLLNGLGAVIATVGNFPAPAADVQQLIVIPDDLFGIEIINNDAVSAHTFSLFLNTGGSS